MKECCANCRNRLHGIKTDFGKLNTDEAIDIPMEGFICLALAYEGVSHWMVNHDEQKGICEMYSPKVHSTDSNSDSENAKYSSDCQWK